MKVLILYASAGSGHKKAAEAFYNQLKNTNPQDGILILDILDFANPVFKFIYSNFYEFLIRRLPFVWGILYYLSNQRLFYIINKRLRFYVDKSNLTRLIYYIIDYNPDYIISTHFLSSELAIYLKEKGKIQSKVVSIVTDFDVHYFLARKGADKYIVATEITRKNLQKFGIPENKIEVLGIPVRDEFFKELERSHLEQKFGLGEGFRALIMTGTLGAGPIEKIVDTLSGYINLIVICGKNRHLFNKLSCRNLPSVKVLGLVDNVYLWMSVSDVLITKAGGLTISEAIVKTLPMIFFFLVPGQEAANAKIMQSYGAAKIAKDIKQIKDWTLELKENPDEIKQMQDNIRKVKFIKITDFIENIINAQ